jgi:hypothetical protein
MAGAMTLDAAYGIAPRRRDAAEVEDQLSRGRLAAVAGSVLLHPGCTPLRGSKEWPRSTFSSCRCSHPLTYFP